MEQKRYLDIRRFDERYASGFREGDQIVIQEKIDGANFSIRYDRETDTVAGFSRNNRLTQEAGLRGAWNWIGRLDKELVREVLGDSRILFGEWLVPHTLEYPKERYRNAYFYDVWDTEQEGYLPQQQVKGIIERLKLIYVPVFYEGPFLSWEQLISFIGKTELGGSNGEGIVIKNMTRLNDPDEKRPFYIKLVTQDFEEEKHVCRTSEKKLRLKISQQTLVESVVTEARVRKILNKMVDEGIIPEDRTEQDRAEIMKSIGGLIYRDCMKEVPEIIEDVGNVFGRFARETAARLAEKILEE